MKSTHQLILKYLLIFLACFLSSAAIVYASLSYLYQPSSSPLSPVSTPSSSQTTHLDPDAPRTEPCPLNGQLFTSAERQLWETRRPLFVMIENHPESRPQSGLSSADIIYEAVAEGGITRFGAVYYCRVAAQDTILGPVRSARTYFINWASEYNYPLYVHVGGANCSPADPNNPDRTCKSDKRVQALEQLDQYGWVGPQGNDFNQFSIGYPTFWRDYERLGRTVATEHTMYTSTEKLYAYAKDKRGWTNLSPSGQNWQDDFVLWQFKDDASPQDRGQVQKISFQFWQGYQDFATTWQYDAQNNQYLRFQGGEEHKDRNNSHQLTAKVVIVQFLKEEGPVDSLKHMFYHNIGQGKALIFQDGQVIQATWSKPSRQARTVFRDSSGQTIKFNRGLIFIEGLPAGNQVDY